MALFCLPEPELHENIPFILKSDKQTISKQKGYNVYAVVSGYIPVGML